MQWNFILWTLAKLKLQSLRNCIELPTIAVANVELSYCIALTKLYHCIGNTYNSICINFEILQAKVFKHCISLQLLHWILWSHFVKMPSITTQPITMHHITSYHIALNHKAFNYNALNHNPLNQNASHCITIDHNAPHYITTHHIASQSYRITLQLNHILKNVFYILDIFNGKEQSKKFMIFFDNFIMLFFSFSTKVLLKTKTIFCQRCVNIYFCPNWKWQKRLEMSLGFFLPIISNLVQYYFPRIDASKKQNRNEIFFPKKVNDVNR